MKRLNKFITNSYTKNQLNIFTVEIQIKNTFKNKLFGVTVKSDAAVVNFINSDCICAAIVLIGQRLQRLAISQFGNVSVIYTRSK
jgi:hypothetical protein